MDFRYNDRTQDLIDRLEAFMKDHVYPNEARFEAEMAPAATGEASSIIHLTSIFASRTMRPQRSISALR